MKTGGFMRVSLLLLLSSLALSSCLLPGMIPLNPESTETAGPVAPAGSTAPEGSLPAMERDPQVVLRSIQEQEGVPLASLAKEQYSEEDSSKPGTLTYTVEITDDRPTYFLYGWCTTTEEILLQNFEHIKIGYYLNGEALEKEVVHAFPSQVNDMVCLNFVTLLSNWPNGEYQLTAVATFEEEINDGLADFDAGEYIYDYNVTVNK